MLEETTPDASLHDANAAAHRVAGAAGKVLKTRGDAHVEAFRELKAEHEHYVEVCEGVPDTVPDTRE